jgi:mannose-6-phosphate isomerase-like protein (cupin superfamily)
MEKVNIRKELASLKEHWSQQIIGEANGQLFKVAKGIGETKWHSHNDQDELFILYKGHLTIQLRDQNIELFEDEMFIVPKSVEHCPKAQEEAEFLIVGLA